MNPDKTFAHVMNLIAVLLFMVAAFGVYTFFMSHVHGNGWIRYTNSPFPVESSEYAPGEAIAYFPIIKRTTPIEKTVTRTLQTKCGDSHDFEKVRLSNTGRLGNFTFREATAVIPEGFSPCDEAWISGTTSYQPSRFRRVSVHWKTEVFSIKNR